MEPGVTGCPKTKFDLLGRKLQTTFQCFSDAISVQDYPSCKYVRVNQSFLDLYDLHLEEVLGYASYEVIAYEGVSSKGEPIFRKGCPLPDDDLLVQRTRRGKWVLVRESSRVFEVDGEYYLITIGRDASCGFKMTGSQETHAEYLAMVCDVLQRFIFPASNETDTEEKQAFILDWVRVLQKHSPNLEEHSLRVMGMALRVGEAMGLSDAAMNDLQMGALLHDIGKIGVPEEILNKETPLLPEEWQMIRLHPAIAGELLADIPFLQQAVEVALCHHERWDGGGYPYGLKGSAIPLAARIVSVVDVWDALTQPRSYHEAWSKSKARAMLKAQSGSLFDPEIVEIFLNGTDQL